MTSINDFIKQEEQNMSRFDKWIKNYPKVTTTFNYATQTLKKPVPEQTTIGPSSKSMIIAFSITLIALWLWLGILGIQRSSAPFLGILFFGLFLTFIVCLMFNKSVFDRGNHLTIDKFGISIDNNKFLWKDVEGTYIMNKQEGKYTNYYLIIFKNDRTVEKLNLRSMPTNYRKLSTLVEYYKLQWRTSELVRQTV
jgi:hypothetical protein